MKDLVVFGKDVDTHNNTTLNIESLVSSRLLIQANSGGGKSYLLRKLVEESFGKVPIILFDLEGEFATLREKYAFVLVGSVADGAEVQISVKTAPMLAKRLMELNANAILDMSELKAYERHQFVRKFCEAMIALPKNLWQPVLIIIDEIHVFCPQKEKSEASPAVIDIFTRGRKRGICGVGATQRISKFNKDAAAECNNKLIGRCVLDVDMKRASEEIGFTTKDDMRSLRDLAPGQFYAFGPALAVGVNKVQVSEVKTSHPKIGARILVRDTPQPEKIKHLLNKLTDLQGEAEKKEKTEEDFKHEIALLRGQLLAAQRNVPRPQVQVKPVIQIKNIAVPFVPILDPEIHGIEKALGNLISQLKKKEKEAEILRRKMQNTGTWADVNILSKLPEKIQRTQLQVIQSSEKSVAKSVKIDEGDYTLEGEPQKLRAGAMRMLEAVASFSPKPITRQQIGALVGMVFRGGTFNVYLQELKRAGWIEIDRGEISITQEGIMAAGDFEPVSRKPDDLLNMWSGKFRMGAAKMLREIAGRYPNHITKEEIGEALGMVYSGGTFNVYLQELRRAGLIEISREGIRATKELFPKDD